MNLLENEILKYGKRGFKKDEQRKLKYGLKTVLVKKSGIFGTDEFRYTYFVDESATPDTLVEFFKDYEKFYEKNSLGGDDKGLFLCSGSINEKLFKELRQAMISKDKIRNSIRLIAEKSTESNKEQKTEEKEETKKNAEQSPLNKDVFIVHGKDYTAIRDLKVLLFELGLNPKVLRDQASGSRTILEQLEKHSEVGYAFVILTPDDVGMEKSLFEKIITKPEEYQKMGLCYRARQNVILEFGFFMGLLSRKRVCCLYKGDIELPSDMQGIVYIRFENSIEEIQPKIMKELKEAGYEIEI